MAIRSPLTKSENVKKITALKVSQIIENYKQDFNLDVSSYFGTTDEVDVYECMDTQLRFYYPFGLAGDGVFYDHLSNFKREYYPKDKWDFAEASKYINRDDLILDIGCGEGHFLRMISNKTNNCIGLDLSPRAVKLGQEKGLDIRNELIQSHAEIHSEKYDVVLAFQLFEHIEDIIGMFESALKAVKKGGKLIISVPNNSSLIFKLNKYHTLNIPPHHVLLWDEESLKSVAKLFNIKLISLGTEPETKFLKSEIYKLKLENWLGKGKVSKFIHDTTRWLIKLFDFNMKNHSIIAIYEKI